VIHLLSLHRSRPSIQAPNRAQINPLSHLSNLPQLLLAFLAFHQLTLVCTVHFIAFDFKFPGEPTGGSGPVLLTAVAADMDGERGVTVGDTVTLSFDRATTFAGSTSINSPEVPQKSYVAHVTSCFAWFSADANDQLEQYLFCVCCVCDVD
jgi:hypothetical protein